jgi:hypothetical protein
MAQPELLVLVAVVVVDQVVHQLKMAEQVDLVQLL